jgi:hypothetical protein
MKLHMGWSLAPGGVVARKKIGRKIGQLCDVGRILASLSAGWNRPGSAKSWPSTQCPNSRRNLAMAAFCLGVLATLALIFVCWAFSEPMK